MLHTIQAIPMILTPIVPGSYQTIEPGSMFQFLWPPITLDNPDGQESAFEIVNPQEALSDIVYQVSVHAELQKYNEITCAPIIGPEPTTIHGVFSTNDDSVVFSETLFTLDHIISSVLENIRGCLSNPCVDQPSRATVIVPKDTWNALRETQDSITFRTLFIVSNFLFPIYTQCEGGNTITVSISFQETDVVEDFVPEPGPVQYMWRSYEKVKDHFGNMVWMWGEPVTDPLTGQMHVRLKTTPNERYWSNGLGFSPKEKIGAWPGDVTSVAPVPFTYEPQIIRFSSAGPRDIV